jgi:FtsH-binding integral membrane protein
MGIDQIKIIYTYTIATIIVVGGLAILYFARLDPPESQSQNLSLVIAGFVGIALQFVFQRETQTSTARQVERGIAVGAASQPTVTTNSGPPTTTTVTPPEPLPDDAP